MEILPIVLARGGSKRIPRKNVLPMAGKPMIAWTIECALHTKGLEQVVVSTDDIEIADVCSSLGAYLPFMRPSELAEDTTTSADVVIHLLEWLSGHGKSLPEFILLLQPTSPLRIPEDIDASISLQKERNADSVVSVCRSSHPFSFLRKINDDGRISLVGAGDSDDFFCYLNGAVYLVKTPVFLREKRFIPLDTLAYEMPVERSIDVDTPWDFYLADLILKDRYASTYS